MIKQVDAGRSKCILQAGTNTSQSQFMFENNDPKS